MSESDVVKAVLNRERVIQYPAWVKDWRDAVRFEILYLIMRYPEYISMQYDINCLLNPLVTDSYGYDIVYRFHKHLRKEDVKSVLLSMYADGLIEGKEFVCECCRGKKFEAQEAFQHIKSVILTAKGREEALKVYGHLESFFSSEGQTEQTA